MTDTICLSSLSDGGTIRRMNRTEKKCRIWFGNLKQVVHDHGIVVHRGVGVFKIISELH